MAVFITDKSNLPNINNIVIGYAELTAVKDRRNNIHWALPGGDFTKSKPFAMSYASRLNRMITDNMKRFNSNLLWS